MQQLWINWPTLRRAYAVLFLRVLPIAAAIPVVALAWVLLDAGRLPTSEDLEMLIRIFVLKIYLSAFLSFGLLVSALVINLFCLLGRSYSSHRMS